VAPESGNAIVGRWNRETSASNNPRLRIAEVVENDHAKSIGDITEA